jgi:hypothetical protein
MIDERTNKRLCDAFTWLTAALALLLILTT